MMYCNRASLRPRESRLPRRILAREPTDLAFATPALTLPQVRGAAASTVCLCQKHKNRRQRPPSFQTWKGIRRLMAARGAREYRLAVVLIDAGAEEGVEFQTGYLIKKAQELIEPSILKICACFPI